MHGSQALASPRASCGPRLPEAFQLSRRPEPVMGDYLTLSDFLLFLL